MTSSFNASRLGTSLPPQTLVELHSDRLAVEISLKIQDEPLYSHPVSVVYRGPHSDIGHRRAALAVSKVTRVAYTP